MNDQHQHSELAQDVAEIKKFMRKLQREDARMVSSFKKNMRILYVICGFIGVVLMWYGLWDIVSIIPVIKNPYVATALGFIILIVLGQFYENLVDVSRKVKHRHEEADAH